MLDSVPIELLPALVPTRDSLRVDRGVPCASAFRRLPRHIGFIPDGNRRWAAARGFSKAEGYEAGISPGLRLIAACRRLGIEEVSIYGFTKENVRRPREQVVAFQAACVEFARLAIADGSALLVVGDANSPAFPSQLLPYTKRSPGGMRVNLVVNYTWSWDLRVALSGEPCGRTSRDVSARLGSRGISRVDLVVRWGGKQRLSGFLPVQCAYADMLVIEDLWPDMRLDEFARALHWYGEQDVTLGG